MGTQVPLLKGFFRGLAVIVAVIAWSGPVAAQALLVEGLPGGTTLVLVNQPLADATTVAWPQTAAADEAPGRLIAGRLTLAADLEAALGVAEGEETIPAAPPVVVAVGGVSGDELESLLRRLLAGRAPFPAPVFATTPLIEGGLDRRLGPPGGDATLRLEIALPPPADWRRASAEVLWDMAPQVIADRVPHLRSRIDGEVGVLEGRIDAELAEITVADLRLALARFAADPAVTEDDVGEARRRLMVRRYAALEEHPDAALEVLDRWLAGGEQAVREYVFGIQGVTLSSVRTTAAEWLPLHPGRAQLVLPPRFFNPRFAAGPEIVGLGGDLTAAVLERSGAPLAVVCLRPVMVPDLDGEVTATVLARMARELRSLESRPGSVRVRTMPPLIELAGPADGFGELVEQLTVAYGMVTADDSPVSTAGADGRRKALDLMAGLLGVTEERDPSPATLLRSGNLALGVVAADAETAAEALDKFFRPAPATARDTDIQSVPTVARTRAAAPGGTSVVVVALELPYGSNEASVGVVRELLSTRAGDTWPDARVEILAPYVPGRSLLLLVLEAAGTVDDVEAELGSRWAGLTARTDDDELTPVRRRVAARASAEMSGVAGHARRCAAVAAGASGWRQPAELELEILTTDPEAVSTVLGGFADLAALQTTGAGALPIDDLERR